MFKSKFILAIALGLAAMTTVHAESPLEKQERIVHECSRGMEYAEKALDVAQKLREQTGKSETNWREITTITDKMYGFVKKSLAEDESLSDQHKLDTLRIARISQSILQINIGTYSTVSIPTAVKLFGERCVQDLPNYKRQLAAN